ncbi:MAG: ribonuclease H-like domain-containing protein [bacterium]|nr:ribonuclease H-like domain-containing protein [bacterium]
MIDEVFVHCPGIGPQRETRLKELGFHNWENSIREQEKLPFKKKRKEQFLEAIQNSIEAYQANDIGFLVNQFPNKEHWRILHTYFENATFFDIETTGLYWYESHVTVISAWHRGKLHTFLYGENMDDFLDLVDEADLLVSFNGNCFDVPFIEQTFNIPQIECPHIDLRWVAYHKGYRGGLKLIEKELGIWRPQEICEVDGFEAVELYYQWLKGDLNSLNKLVQYCNADVMATYLLARELCFSDNEAPDSRENDSFFQMAMEAV